MEFIRTSIKKSNSIGEKEWLILFYLLFYIFQVGYLHDSYSLPVLLLISGVKAMFALAGFSKAVGNLQNALNPDINEDLRLSSLFMATVFFAGAIAILVIKW